MDSKRVNALCWRRVKGDGRQMHIGWHVRPKYQISNTVLYFRLRFYISCCDVFAFCTYDCKINSHQNRGALRKLWRLEVLSTTFVHPHRRRSRARKHPQKLKITNMQMIATERMILAKTRNSQNVAWKRIIKSMPHHRAVWWALSVLQYQKLSE